MRVPGWSTDPSSKALGQTGSPSFGGDNLNMFAGTGPARPAGTPNSSGMGSIRYGATNGNTGDNLVGSDLSVMHWFIKHENSQVAVEATHAEGTTRYHWLGGMDTDDDRGKWTDIVIRARWNPLTVAGNPAVIEPTWGMAINLPASTGIYEVWKSEGPVIGAPGDPLYRNMVKRVSLVNESVGSLPGNWADGGYIRLDNRQYRYGWHRSATSMTDPNVIYWDEIRAGALVRDGSSYSDVHPTRQAVQVGQEPG